MTTARDIITSALRKIHVLGIGAPLNAEEGEQALDTLNNMLSTLSVEGYMVFLKQIESFSLVGSQTSYTWFTGGDFNSASPLKIISCYVTQGGTDYNLTQYSADEYAKITDKDEVGSIPNVFYYDNNYPTPRVYLYPTPSTADTINFVSEKYLTEFATLDTAFAFPPEYKTMLIYNLAVWLAGEYEREANPSVVSIALSAKKNVKVRNTRNNQVVSYVSGVPAGDTSSTGDIYGGFR